MPKDYQKKKKVLIVAYHFLPVNNAGVKRPLRFARLLPQFGYQPFVLTTSLFGKFKKKSIFKIIRASELLRLGKRFDPNQKRRNDVGNHFNKVNFKTKVKDFFAYPDGQNSWVPLAVLKGLKTIQKEKIDLIFSTYPPGSTHLVGYLLSRLTKKPWIADFRDGFVFDSPQIRQSWGRIQKWFWQKLEKLIVNRADKLIVVTPQVKDDFLKRYPNLESEKIICITNGFDRDDFMKVKNVQYEYGDQFNLVHTGAISASISYFTPEPFLQGLALFLKENPKACSKVNLNFYGTLTFDEKEMIKRYNLEDITIYHGQVNFLEALKAQTKGDLLLLFDRKRSLSSKQYSNTQMKIFEYLFSRRPILAIAPGWAPVGKYVLESERGFVIKPENTSEIAAKIKELYLAWQKKKLPSNLDETKIMQFDGKNLTEILAKTFNQILDD